MPKFPVYIENEEIRDDGTVCFDLLFKMEVRVADVIAEVDDDTVEIAARAAHEVNKAYCAALGDASQRHWEDAPEWQRESARNGARLHLNGEHGPEESHESWMCEKEADGWRYGPIKDELEKMHPCMVPYDELPPDQRAKDHIFIAVVKMVREVLLTERRAHPSPHTEQDAIAHWFKYDHLPADMQTASRPFGELARYILNNVAPGRERSVALRKLLEAKDAGVRAYIKPGG